MCIHVKELRSFLEGGTLRYIICYIEYLAIIVIAPMKRLYPIATQP